MQSVDKTIRKKPNIAEGVAIALAVSVALVAATRVVPPAHGGRPDHVVPVQAKASLPAMPDEAARMIADMQLHD